MKKFSQSIIFLMVACCLSLPHQAKADLFNVTSLIDGASGSLRVAISGAASGDTIQFSPLLDGLLNTLVSGDILIEESIVILGNGINATQIHGNNLNRIFRIGAGAQVTIRDLTLDGGNAMIGGAIRLQGGVANLFRVRIRNSVATGSMATQGGGAIVNEGGMLMLDECELLNCSATGTSGSGGAILNLDGGMLTVQNTTISGNVAARAGGGIEDNSGNTSLVSLVNVQFMENHAGSAPGNGGAVHITGNGDLSITGGVVSNNTASAEGGGLWNGTGAMTINNVTIENNTASGAAADQGGGGVFNAGGAILISGNTLIQGNAADGAAGSGGGILNDAGGTLTVENSTISGNTAIRAGGGIEDNSGSSSTITLLNVTLDGNSTASSPGNGGGVHITGPGDIDITGGVVSNNTASAEGGGLWNGTGVMTITNVMINSNTASGAAADQGGGGVFNAGGTVIISGSTVIGGNVADGAAGSGGGVLNDAGGTLTIEGATFSSNTAIRAGGGIEDNSGSGSVVTLTNVILDGNITGGSPGNGGGVHITGPGDMDITGGVVSNNTASAEGGGLWNGSGVMTLTNVTVDGNVATGASMDQGGGGVFNAGGMIMISASTLSNNTVDGDGSGAGLNNDAGGTVMLRYSTISGNSSSTAGGGITNAGTLTVVASTIADNSATADGGGVFQAGTDNSVDFNSSIIATNTTGGAGVDITGMGTITSSGYNLVGIDDTDSFMGDGTDVEGDIASPADPNLEPLAANGGMTETHALGCPSPAINAGDPNNMDPDQRGEMVFEGRRDMGAYERQEACTVSTEELEQLLGSTVYPNPLRSGLLTLEIPTSYGYEVWIEATAAATGRLVLQQRAATGQVQLDLSNFSSGIYHIQLKTAEAVVTHKVVMLKE